MTRTNSRAVTPCLLVPSRAVCCRPMLFPCSSRAVRAIWCRVIRPVPSRPVLPVLPCLESVETPDSSCGAFPNSARVWPRYSTLSLTISAALWVRDRDSGGDRRDGGPPAAPTPLPVSPLPSLPLPSAPGGVKGRRRRDGRG